MRSRVVLRSIATSNFIIGEEELSSVMAQKRAHILYSGTVQGVGFRFTAQEIAGSLGLSGWVRNCPDGTVEVVTEGEEEKIKAFLDKIKATIGNYIRSAMIEWESPTGEFDAFGIKFS